MRFERIILEQGNYRIVEIADETYSFDDLCGDTYKPELHPEIPAEKILEELEHFKDLVNREGVFGYELQVWNPNVNCGWEHVDSCWGFVGQFTPTEETFNHYIVDELKSQIKIGA